MSKASLQTSQSSKEAGRLELSWRPGVSAEIAPGVMGSDEGREKYGLPA